MILNLLAIRLNGPEAAGELVTINLRLEDTGEQAALRLSNGVLSHSNGRRDENADLSMALSREALNRLVTGESTVEEESEAGRLTVDPDLGPVVRIFALLDSFDPWFHLIEP